ncbi:MAG: hypothetical protein A3J42_09915 [Candidatus Dadabacteria bacterium RIFCSPHIGHO2_12_FULL_53_21]|nr:MAG: hypothetical protein A3J42_09915 [Candidatus Dadabacteria bacterium RIFCSPHIGHO2_12_FULL_53_21]
MSGRKPLALAISFGVLILGLYAFRFVSGTHTEYCPLSHKLSDTADCIVLHVSRGRVLVRHRDSYTREAYFEIITNGRSQKFDIPEFSLKGGAPKKFRVRLIDNEPGAVTINGARFDLLPLTNGDR